MMIGVKQNLIFIYRNIYACTVLNKLLRLTKCYAMLNFDEKGLSPRWVNSVK